MGIDEPDWERTGEIALASPTRVLSSRGKSIGTSTLTAHATRTAGASPGACVRETHAIADAATFAQFEAGAQLCESDSSRRLRIINAYVQKLVIPRCKVILCGYAGD